MKLVIDILTYPYRGSGKYILIMCAILSLIAALSGFAPFFGLIASILFFGYFCAVFFQMIQSTATGGKEAPAFPETANIMEDIIHPMLQVFGVIILSFSPYFIYINLSDDHSIVSTALITLGLIYFPMALLAVIILGRLSAANPLIVFPSIFRAGWTYWLGISLLILLYLVENYLEKLLSGNIFIEVIVMSTITSYTLMANARTLGLIYRERQEELYWI